jgi:hypothetical protein
LSLSVRPADRKIAEIRSAARALELGGDVWLAELLKSIANAYENFREDAPAYIDEALRWTPVLYAATRIARQVRS